MEIPKEIEMKLQVSDEISWQKLLSFFSSADEYQAQGQIKMTADYYDTIDGKMSEQRIAYRLRRENDELVATIKGRGSVENGLHRRLECNVIVNTSEPDLTVFNDTPAAELVREFLDRPLVRMVCTDFVRTVFYVKRLAAEIEIAMDKGHISSRGESVPILEVELELKSGDESAVRELAAELLLLADLKPAGESKLARGMKLWKINE